MTTIGTAVLQIIPSLRGVSDAINQQLGDKPFEVSVEPKVDQRAAERAGKQARETVEKHTTEVKIEPQIDLRKSEQAGKATGEAATKGAAGSSTAIGQAITGALEGAGGEGGRRLGERLAQSIPTGMSGAAQRIGTALRNSLPTVGAAAGTMAGTAIGTALTDAIGGDRLQKAGQAISRGLTSAVAKANAGTDIAVAISNSVAGGLSSASGVIGGAAAALTDTIGGIGSAITTTKDLLGGDDSWAAPGLDILNGALGKATPLLEGMNAASMLASAGAKAISIGTQAASKAQWLWNAALTANPIGLIVAAIAAVVAGLVLFFTKTELGQKIWKGFTEFMSKAWEKVKIAFQVAWEAIKIVWDAMVTKAGEVWQGIKDRFTAVVDFVKSLPGKIRDAAKGMWDGIGNAFKSMVNGLISVWNRFADMLSFTVPDIPGVPGRGEKFSPVPKIQPFSTGGYTGAAAADKIAGVVHGDEFVIKSQSRRGIENAYPGLLDYLNNKGRLPGYESGGLVDAAKRFAVSLDPAKYLMGGFSPTAIDCSGFVSAVANVATGRQPFESRMSTVTEGAWLKSLGFKSGRGGAGDLRVGWWDKGGGANGHTAGTFPDGTNFESNGSEGVVIGGKTGANDGQFTQHAYLPVSKVSGGDILSGLGVDTSGSAAPEAATSSSTAPTGSGTSTGSGVSVPSSLSGLSTFGLDGLGVTTQASPDAPERTFDVGGAASAAVGGQVSSALDVLGVGNSPGWLQAASTFVSGISVSDASGNKVFDGSNLFGGFGQGAGASAAPLAATPTVRGAAPVPDGAASGGGGGQPAGPQTVNNWNIRTATVEDAYLQAERKANEQRLAKLAHI